MNETQHKWSKRAKTFILESHWPRLIEGLQFSSLEFYDKLEKALEDRQMPGLRICRVDWKEGGPLSARREYLRITRQRLTFDICAAPVGTGFFVSLWFGEKPLKLALLELTFFAGLIAAILEWYYLSWTSLGRWMFAHMHLDRTTTTICFCAIGLGALVLIIIRTGASLDDLLINTPVLGYFYERFFRRITLYRVDLACMYRAAVHAAVVQVVDEITKTQGIKPLSELDRRPVFRELLQRPLLYGRK